MLGSGALGELALGELETLGAAVVASLVCAAIEIYAATGGAVDVLPSVLASAVSLYVATRGDVDVLSSVLASVSTYAALTGPVSISPSTGDDGVSLLECEDD